jgi:hypothetical protein
MAQQGMGIGIGKSGGGPPKTGSTSPSMAWRQQNPSVGNPSSNIINMVIRSPTPAKTGVTQ